MTEKDRELISMALTTRTNWEWIEEKLLPQAETDECRRELQELADLAFRCFEMQTFDF